MDKRLFPDSQLYCEGRKRTHLRGWFHFFMCITFFPMMAFNYIYILYNTDKTNIRYISFIACFTNLIIIYAAHCVSAFYHICELDFKHEVIAQKIDIIGANLYVASSYLPMALLLFPTNIGIGLLSIAGGLVGWNIHSIIHSNYSLHQPLYICLLQVLFFYYIYEYLTRTELIFNLSGLFLLSIGSIFLFKEICPSMFDQTFFDSFEMYHGFSVLCLMTTCLMNYSIFKRTILID